jgi:predicted ATPase
MLKSVRLKNFKLHEDTSIEAAPITVFIGPNNTGKSSIFQALVALRQSAIEPSDYYLQSAQRQSTSSEHPFLFRATDFVDLGEFKDVVSRGRREIQIGLGGVLPSIDEPFLLGPAEVSFEVGVQDNRFARHEGIVKLPEGEVRWKHISSARPGIFPQPLFRLGDSALRFDTLNHFPLLQPTSPEVLPNTSVEFVNRLLQTGRSLATATVQILSSIHAILPLRGFEEWGCPLAKYPRANIDRLVLVDRAVAIANSLAGNSKVRKQVSDRLRDLVKIGIDIEVVGGNRVRIYATSAGEDSAETLFTNEGTGANQLPFILVPIALASPNETVLLSEPEAHLHPKAQCELTRMLLTVAKKENIQFFIETHSEHVLHTILNAVARGEWNPADVALYYFQNKNGIAEVGKREINQFGQVDGGLPDFFEQSLAELTDYLKALSKT